MILPGGVTRAYLATRPVDFRKGHAGLALVVQNVLGHDPYNGAVYRLRQIDRVFRADTGGGVGVTMKVRIDGVQDRKRRMTRF